MSKLLEKIALADDLVSQTIYAKDKPPALLNSKDRELNTQYLDHHYLRSLVRNYLVNLFVAGKINIEQLGQLAQSASEPNGLEFLAAQILDNSIEGKIPAILNRPLS